MEDLGHVQLSSPVGTSDAEEHSVRIVQLTDLHQWPKGVDTFAARGRVIDFGKEGFSAEKNLELVAHVVKESVPDLVVLTGDILDGRPCADMGRDSWKQVLGDVIKPLVEQEVPWTFVPGNHDDDASPWSREDLLEIFSLPLCASKGATSFNHTFTVSRRAAADAETAVRLWLFDSGANSPDPKVRYTTFSAESVQGYEAHSQSADLAPSAVGLAFFHIPLPEYEGVVPLAGRNGLFDAAANGGLVPWPLSHEPFSSVIRWLGKDLVAGCSKLNSGFFEALKRQGNVRATFCGHDHHSDFVGKRDGVYLCYGRCGSYTPPSTWEGAAGDFKFDRGARVIHFKGADKLYTWNCTFDAPVEDLFHLE